MSSKTSIVYVNHYHTHTVESLDKALALLTMLAPMKMSPDVYQPVARESVREMIWVHNVLSRMTEQPQIEIKTTGIDNDETGKVKVYDLTDKHNMEYTKKVFDMVKGAVSDPFIHGNDPVGCEGFREAAITNLHKARYLMAALLAGVFVKEEAKA
jgi:hypothetical protein